MPGRKTPWNGTKEIKSFSTRLKTLLKKILLTLLTGSSAASLQGSNLQDMSVEELLYRDENLVYYIDDYCNKQKGYTYNMIESGYLVDCTTKANMWKIDYAYNWKAAFVEAMNYGIYSNFYGEQKYAPRPGVVLIQEDAADYKSAVKLRQLIEYYKLPMKVDIIENYTAKTAADKHNPPPSKEFGQIRFTIGK